LHVPNLHLPTKVKVAHACAATISRNSPAVESSIDTAPVSVDSPGWMSHNLRLRRMIRCRLWRSGCVALVFGATVLGFSVLPGSAASGWKYSGHVTYSFVGGSGNRNIDVSWRGRKYLIRSSVGEFLFIDLEIRNRIYVCAPTLQQLKKGAWPNNGGTLKFCTQYRTTGNNEGVTEADNELGHYFSPVKNYLPHPQRAGAGTYAGVRSDCFTGKDAYANGVTDTLCVAHSGNYLTYMKIPNARWTATKAGTVNASQLVLPRGVNILSLGDSAKIIP
jgi:hypothetical protein